MDPIKSVSKLFTSVRIQSNGKIIVSGYYANDKPAPNYDFIVARFDDMGLLDSSFGTDGIVKTEISPLNDIAASMLIQGDDKIIVAGGSGYFKKDFDFTLVRYNSEGVLDSTFGNAGIAVVQIPGSFEFAYSLAIQYVGNGVKKIVASGIQLNATKFSEQFITIRYNMDGSLDNTFGNGGINILKVGTTNSEGNEIAIQKDGKIIIGGTEYSGGDFDVSQNNRFFTLVRYDNTPVTNVKDINKEEFPNSFVLEQNYPNPFNPTTKIKYSIPASLNPSKGGTLTQLKIYDTLGREVTTLVNKNQQPGNYDVNFNAANLASGVYFYQLKAGNFIQIKKMVLLR